MGQNNIISIIKIIGEFIQSIEQMFINMSGGIYFLFSGLFVAGIIGVVFFVIVESIRFAGSSHKT